MQLNDTAIVLNTRKYNDSSIIMKVITEKQKKGILVIKKLLNDQPYLDKILLEGVEKANSIASKKINRIKEILGF